MVLSEDEREFILENLSNGQKLIESEDVDGILENLDILILEKGFVDYDDGGLNDFGRKAQRIYDNIWMKN